jgi:hypothetical protein
MTDGQTLEEQLAGLDDTELLGALNAALAKRRSTSTQTPQERDDDQFYRSLYPDDSRHGPRVLPTTDES